MSCSYCGGHFHSFDNCGVKPDDAIDPYAAEIATLQARLAECERERERDGYLEGRTIACDYAMKLERENDKLQAELVALREKAQALIDYETTGAPEYPNWDEHFIALRDALEK